MQVLPGRDLSPPRPDLTGALSASIARWALSPDLTLNPSRPLSPFGYFLQLEKELGLFNFLERVSGYSLLVWKGI